MTRLMGRVCMRPEHLTRMTVLLSITFLMGRAMLVSNKLSHVIKAATDTCTTVDTLEDQFYNAVVDMGYNDHIPTSGETNRSPQDDIAAWDHDLPASGLTDFDFGLDYDLAWPGGLAADLNEGDPITEQPASDADQDQIHGREIRQAIPTGYNPNRPLLNWSAVSLSDTYRARQAARNSSSGLGLGNCE